MRKLFVILAVCATACGGSDSNSNNTNNGDSDTGAGLTDHVCDNIPKADMQALVTATISNVTEYAETCQEDVLTVGYNDSDADQSGYNADANAGWTPHQLSGFGDAAYWAYFLDEPGIPSVNVRKGSNSCALVTGDGDLDDFTMVHSGTHGAWQVADSDAANWAALAAKTCVDILDKL